MRYGEKWYVMHKSELFFFFFLRKHKSELGWSIFMDWSHSLKDGESKEMWGLNYLLHVERVSATPQ